MGVMVWYYWPASKVHDQPCVRLNKTKNPQVDCNLATLDQPGSCEFPPHCTFFVSVDSVKYQNRIGYNEAKKACAAPRLFAAWPLNERWEEVVPTK
jgi:hypothetical protein